MAASFLTTIVLLLACRASWAQCKGCGNLLSGTSYIPYITYTFDHFCSACDPGCNDGNHYACLTNVYGIVPAHAIQCVSNAMFTTGTTNTVCSNYVCHYSCRVSKDLGPWVQWCTSSALSDATVTHTACQTMDNASNHVHPLPGAHGCGGADNGNPYASTAILIDYSIETNTSSMCTTAPMPGNITRSASQVGQTLLP